MLNEVKSEWGIVTLPSTGPQSLQRGLYRWKARCQLHVINESLMDIVKEMAKVTNPKKQLPSNKTDTLCTYHDVPL